MTFEQFLTSFAEQFDDTDSSIFNAETEFHTIDEWSSMTALGIIGMLDTEYGISITGADLQNCKSIQDLYNLAMERKK